MPNEELQKQLDEAKQIIDRLKEERRMEDVKWKEETTIAIKDVRSSLARVEESSNRQESVTKHLNAVIFGIEGKEEKGLEAQVQSANNRIQALENRHKFISKIIWLLSGIGLTGIAEFIVRHTGKP